MKTLRDLVRADLARGQRLIIRVQDELDPQWRIATPQGDVHVALQLPAAENERLQLLARVGQLMDLKQAIGFTLVSEVGPPDMLVGMGVTRAETALGMVRITRDPKPWTTQNFGPIDWRPATQIDPMIAGLMPRGPAQLTKADHKALHELFGPAGRFPVVELASGRVGAL